MKTKRAFLVEPRRIELLEVEIFPEAHEVVVKVATCGLCNWEQNYWKGIIGSCPQSLGHEWAGTVVEVGKEVDNLSIGDMVAAMPDGLKGFSEYVAISGKNCVKLAQGINPRYALGEPLKCVITVLRASTHEAGDHAVIQGCGPMGLWCIQALSGHLLSSLVAVDIDDTRLELAQKFGCTHIINSKKQNASEEIRKITEGNMADLVIEGTGIPALLNSAQTYLRMSGRGRLVLMSSHETACKEFDFRESIKRSANIIIPHPNYSLNTMDDFNRAVSLLNKGIFNIKDTVTHTFSLDNIQKAFETLENKPAGYLKGIVIP